MRSGRPAVAALVLAVALATGCTADAEPRPGPRPDAPDSETGSDARSALATRAAHTMTPVTGGLLVAGGCDVDGCASATASTYVVSGTTEGRVGDLHEARDAHTAVALPDGRVLVVGGFAGEGRPPLTSAELFDPSSGRWTPTGPLSLGRGGHAAALLGDGTVLVAGGWVGPQTYTDTTEIYDPVTGEFSPGPRLPAAADGLAAASLRDGCVLVVGGQVRSQVATDLAVTVCPDGRLTRLPPLGTARFKHGIATLASGEVLVVGGTPDDAALLTSTEVYDPAAQRFRPGPELVSGRYKMTDSVVALPGRRAVVAGGGDGVEIVDLETGGAAAVPGLGSGRHSFSTLGVTRGRLVLVGGYDEQIRLTGTYASVSVDEF